jgi:hypothetical protein
MKKRGLYGNDGFMVVLRRKEASGERNFNSHRQNKHEGKTKKGGYEKNFCNACVGLFMRKLDRVGAHVL